MTQWTCNAGSLKLIEGRLKANRKQSSGCKGIVKKRSFKSITIRCQSLRIATGEGSPCCSGPIICMVLFTTRRSWSNLHLPDFFFSTRIGVFQGDMDGTICPASNCSCTKAWAAHNFSSVRGHCSTHTGSSDNHVIGMGAGDGTVTRTKNVPAHCSPLEDE